MKPGNAARPLSPSISTPPEWRLERRGLARELRLTGDWIARETGVRSAAEVRRILDEADGATLRVDVSGLGRWDSALIAFLEMLRDAAAQVDDWASRPPRDSYSLWHPLGQRMSSSRGCLNFLC